MTTMFILSGVNKFMDITTYASGLQKRFPIKNLPLWFFQISIVIVASLQLFGSIFIVLSTTNLLNNFMSKKNIKLISAILSICLVLFTILATLIYHYPPKGKEYYAFISNLTTVGGFLLLADYIYNK